MVIDVHAVSFVQPSSPRRTTTLIKNAKIGDLFHTADIMMAMQAIMDVRGNEFAERLFKALDAKCMGSVTSEQLVDTLLALKSGTVQEKIAFIWSFTASDEGHITRDELQALLRVSLSMQLRILVK